MNRLKMLREENGMLQDEVGALIGVSGRAIGHYENGFRDISHKNLTILANYFNVSIDYLLGNSDIRTSSKINYDHELEKIGLSTKELNTISDSTKNEIKSFIEYIKNKEKK